MTSREDLQLNDRLHKAGKILGIPLLDSLVIGEDGYSSCKDRGLL